jgi:uncharacterized protein (DUF983 family)
MDKKSIIVIIGIISIAILLLTLSTIGIPVYEKMIITKEDGLNQNIYRK